MQIQPLKPPYTITRTATKPIGLITHKNKEIAGKEVLITIAYPEKKNKKGVELI
jgi:hypothetical protein